MLHDLGAGNGTILVDVPHDEHGDLLLFCNGKQPGGTLLDLTDRAGRGRNVHTAHGLDGVDDHKIRLFLLDQAADLVHIVFGSQIDVFLRDLQPGGTQLDLTHRLFTGDIQDAVLVGDGSAELQQHGGFANARLAAEQDHTAQHDAAAQHPIQFRNAGQDAAFFLRRADVCQPPGCQRGNTLLSSRSRRFAARKPCFGGFGNDIFVHGIPASAAGAATHPAGACLSAVGADIYSF